MNIKESTMSPESFTHQQRTTMSSFDTIMAKLSERHPEVSRQRIVDSLLELQANHQGFLSGLPLKAVVEMTSALLKHPPLDIKERLIFSTQNDLEHMCREISLWSVYHIYSIPSSHIVLLLTTCLIISNILIFY